MDASYSDSFGSFEPGEKKPDEFNDEPLENGASGGGSEVNNGAGVGFRLGRSEEDLNGNDLNVNHPMAEGQISVNLKEAEDELERATRESLENEMQNATDIREIELDKRPVSAGEEELYLRDEGVSPAKTTDDGMDGASASGMDVGMDNTDTDGTNMASSASPSIAPTMTPIVDGVAQAGNTVRSADGFASFSASNSDLDEAPRVFPTTGVGSSMNTGMITSAGMNPSMMVAQQAPTSSVGAGLKLAPINEKKPKKGLIIGIIVVVVLAIAAVVIGIMMGSRSSGSQNARVSGSVKEAFNSYINYVWYGEDSIEDFDIERLNEKMPFYMKTKESGDGIDEYLDVASKKYKNFEDKYYYDDFGTENTNDLSTYFEDYVGAGISINKIVENYLEFGYEPTAELINKSFETDNTDYVFLEYVEVDRKRNLLELDIIARANSTGCIINKTLEDGCYTIPSDLNEQYIVLMNEAYDYSLSLRRMALNTLDNINNELFTIGVGDES